MNTSLSDDEFDGLLADDNLKNEKTYLQRIPKISLPRWQSKSWNVRELFLLHPGFQIACLIANIIGLTIIAFSFTFLLPALRNQSGAQCVLATDSLLGENSKQQIPKDRRRKKAKMKKRDEQ
jgi:hypothetical protein